MSIPDQVVRWWYMRHQVVAVHVPKKSLGGPILKLVKKLSVPYTRTADRIERHVVVHPISLETPDGQRGQRSAEAVAREVNPAVGIFRAVCLQEPLCVCPDNVQSLREASMHNRTRLLWIIWQGIEISQQIFEIAFYRAAECENSHLRTV